jgi:hypothetical protein
MIATDPAALALLYDEPTVHLLKRLRSYGGPSFREAARKLLLGIRPTRTEIGSLMEQLTRGERRETMRNAEDQTNERNT